MIMIAFGVLGVLLKKLDYEGAPLALALKKEENDDRDFTQAESGKGPKGNDLR
jgi:TctA family transporter